MSSSLLTGDASDRSFAPFSVGNVGAAVAEAGPSSLTDLGALFVSTDLHV